MVPSTTNLNAKSLPARMKQAGGQGDGDALVALAKEVAACATLPDMGEAAHRLIGITQKAAPQRIQEVAQILVRAGTPVSRPYLALVAALETAAPLEAGVARFMASRRQAKDVLQAAVAAVPEAEACSQQLRLRLARVLWQLGDDESLTGLLNEVAARALQGYYSPGELARLALISVGTSYGIVLYQAVSSAFEQHPDSLEILRAHVRGLLEAEQAIEPLWPCLKQAAMNHPEDSSLKRFTASCAYRVCDWETAEKLLLSLAHQFDKSEDWEKAGLAALRLGNDERALQWLARARPRVRGQHLGVLASALEPLLNAVNRDYEYSDRVDHQALKYKLGSSLEHLGHRLPTIECATTDLLQAANILHAVETCPFYILEHFLQHHPYVTEWDAHYGTFDLQAYTIVWRALVEHQALLLDVALERLLVGSGVGTLTGLREITERFTEAHLMLDRPAAAIQKIKNLIAGGCDGLFFEELIDRCLLQEGLVHEVEARVAARPVPNEGKAKVCAVAQVDAWIRREQLEPRVLWEEGAFDATFETIGNDRQIENHPHRVGALTLRAMQAKSLTVAGSEILIGRHGTVLRPPGWHYRGLFPKRTGLAVTTAVNGTVLKLTGPVRRIEEPVVILAVNDTVRQHNYYHWINYILTRCVFLLEQGLLQDRRLLMPTEILPWMQGALELVGIADRLVSYGVDEVLHIDDAMVVSTFDYPGAEYMRRFRRFMWKAAGVGNSDPPSKTARHIFMIRPTNAKRPLFGRDRILHIAQEEGFDCVNPVGLSVAEQVSLFSNAASVAGLTGATFTNVAFCQPGTPVLELTRRETAWPDFIGIALALDLEHRLCLGRIDPSVIGTPNMYDAPPRFDENLVREQLKMLKERSCASPRFQH